MITKKYYKAAVSQFSFADSQERKFRVCDRLHQRRHKDIPWQIWIKLGYFCVPYSQTTHSLSTYIFYTFAEVLVHEFVAFIGDFMR